MIMHEADPAFVAMIPALYTAFAVQLFWQLRKAPECEAKRAIRNLVFVFIACAVAGYIFDLADFGRLIGNAMHFVLALAALALVVSNAAGHIAEMLIENARLKARITELEGND